MFKRMKPDVLDVSLFYVLVKFNILCTHNGPNWSNL